jgi:type VI secretion system secreted protein VgrG
MTPLEIIKTVLQENKVLFEDKTTSAGRKKRVFCVQYGESAFDFVSRLMEEEGIFYFFTHGKDRHTLVFMDDSKKGASLGSVAFSYAQARAALFADRVLGIQRIQDVRANRVMLNDYHFEKPEQKLLVSLGKASFPLGVYTYPGLFTELSQGEKLSEKHLQAHECLKVQFEGVSSSLSLTPGHKVKVKDCRSEVFNAEYFLLSVHHHYGLNSAGERVFQNTFRAIPVNVSFRALEQTPKPVAYQDTAVVVGGRQDEIYTDGKGHIKVKFHFDARPTSAVKDEDRSCWIRVATPSAGSGWGMVHTPRVGQEVVVAFLNNNPDRPLVIGSVYNKKNVPPYVDPTQSGVRTHTTKEGKDETFNEIRFDDAKGKEHVAVQAQKDATFLVKDALTTTVQKGSFKTTIMSGNREVVLQGKDGATSGKGDDLITLEKGSRLITLKGSGGHLKTTVTSGNNEVLVKKGNDQTVLESGDHVITLKKGKKSVTISGGGYTLKITGGDVVIETTGQLKVNAKGGINLSTVGKMSLDCMSFDLKAKTSIAISGLQLKLEAKTQATLEGKAQTAIKGAMVDVAGQAMTQIKGAMVMLN